MAINGNNLEPEFDALLKTHIKQRASAAVCAQFDPDNASAYLEQAMSNAAQASFEAHLASCAVCRRQLIELSRLMPAPVSVAEPIVVRTTFTDRLSEWFSGWRLGVMTGVGAVAATILLVAVVVNRNSSETGSPMIAAHQKELSAQVTPLPAPSSSAKSDHSASEEAQESKAIAANSPTPSATLVGSKDAAHNASAGSSATANLPEPARVAVTAIPPPPPATTPAPSKAEAAPKESDVPPPVAGTAQNRANNFRVQTPSGPETNQMQAERALELRKRNEQSEQLADTVAATAPRPAAPASKSAEPAAERQEGQRKDAVADEAAKKRAPARPVAEREKISERPARPERTIAGKTFRQEGGVWVDTTYEANRTLPVVRLTRDSETYKQTLKDAPGLAPYFNLYPVVVVWQGKVYRVETK